MNQEPIDFYTLYFDGACKPSPGGIGTYAYIINHSGEIIKEESGIIGEFYDMTNHFAEFFALYKGLIYLKTYLIRSGRIHVTVKGDSDLVIKILSKKWRGNNTKMWSNVMKKCINITKELRNSDISVNFTWIPREKNQRCDMLTHKVLTK